VRRHPIRAPDALEAKAAGPGVRAVRAHAARDVAVAVRVHLAAEGLEPVVVEQDVAAEVGWRAAMAAGDGRAPAVVAV